LQAALVEAQILAVAVALVDIELQVALVSIAAHPTPLLLALVGLVEFQLALPSKVYLAAILFFRPLHLLAVVAAVMPLLQGQSMELLVVLAVVAAR
jgi:hypothetical protein